MVDLPGGTDANAPTMIDTPARLGAKYAGKYGGQPMLGKRFSRHELNYETNLISDIMHLTQG